MSELTKQEIFDKVVKHLLSQNAKSEAEDGCWYRNPSGLMCAVGCLIDNTHYHSDLEGKWVEEEKVKIALANSGITINDDIISLLSKLQLIHDESYIEFWQDDLKNLAKKFNLEYKGV